MNSENVYKEVCEYRCMCNNDIDFIIEHHNIHNHQVRTNITQYLYPCNVVVYLLNGEPRIKFGIARDTKCILDIRNLKRDIILKEILK